MTDQPEIEFPKKGTNWDLNQFLLETYAYAHWYFKLRSIEYLIDNYDKIKSDLNFMDWVNEEKVQTEPEKVLRSLKAEVFFTTFHIMESLFALLYVIKKHPTNLAQGLVSYKNIELEKFVSEIASGNIFSTDNELYDVIYLGLKPKDLANTDTDFNFDIAIQNVKLILQSAAIRYRDLDVYNAYKHGLRISPGTIEFEITKEGQKIIRDKSQGILSLIKDKKTGLAVKLYLSDYGEEKELAKAIYNTIRFIILLRKGLISKPGQKISIPRIDKLEVDEIFGKPRLRSITMPIKFVSP